MHIQAKFILIVILLSSNVFGDPIVVRIPKASGDYNIAHDYFVGLLRLALQKGAHGKEIPLIVETLDLEQGRAIHELLNNNIIDVYWAGTDRFRDRHLRAIRIPLTRGLLGFRQFIIRKDMAPEFDKIDSLQKLKKFHACQGLAWPDTNILRSAGLSVYEVSGFKNIFTMVAAGRCDYFPRAIYEGKAELLKANSEYPNLILYDSLFLHYPFAVNFFLNFKNEHIALWIERGLEKMIDSGEMLEYMKSNDPTKDTFLKKKRNIRLIEITNADFPSYGVFSDRRYWVQPEDIFVIDK